MKKRIVAFVLAVAMLVISLPLGAIAEGIQIDAMKSNSATAGNSGTAGEQKTDNIGDLYIGESESSYVYWTGAEVTKLSKETDEKTGEEYYVIGTPEELYFLALQVKSGNAEYAEGNYRLTANLSFESGKGEQTPPEMIPIGNEDHPFMGNFDGQGHEVAGYTISRVELTDAEQDAHKTDAKEQYIGLFGYVENATIENLGVRNYQIDYEYFYDCYVGGLVGYSKDSTITNCFADGHTAAACGSMNPLLREDVESYAGSEIPESLSSEKAGGQGVILDFRGMGSAVNKTITVSGTVNAIRLIGDAGKTYTGLNIVLNTDSGYAVYVELLDMNFTGGTDKPALSGTASEVYLYSSTVTAEDGSKLTEGKSNRIAGINGAQTAVDLPDCALNICGDVALSMKGGDDTTNAKAAVTVKSISIDLRDAAGKNVDLTITGGRGKTGATGATGATGTDPTATAGTGGTGGNGYTGAMAVEAEIIAVYAGRASFYGGNGGDGGVGGTGGIGANGSNGTDHGGVRYEYQSSTEPAYSRPTGGGQGGKGGKGGNGGPGAQALECPVLLSGIAEKYVKAGHDGDGGQGGAGGKGGKGGTGPQICARRNSNGWPSKGGPFMTFDDAEEKGKALFNHYDVTPAAGGKGGNGGDGGDGYHAGAGGAPGAGGDGGDAGKKDVDSRYYAAGGFSKKDEQEAYHGVYTSGLGESGQTGELAGSSGSTYPLPGIYGSALVSDSVFLNGSNGAYRVYDNTGAGVTLSVASASSDNPTGLNYELVVKSVSGSDGRHMGGYFHEIWSESNKVVYYVVCAKIPVGYRIGMYSNALGKGAYAEWLTDDAGTGEWEWYIGKTVCGSNGTFETLGFVAIYPDGGTDTTVEWRVAYNNLVDAGVCNGGATVDSLNTPIVSYRTGNKEYAVYPGLVSWELAEEWCEARGGYLATITSAEENALLVSLLDQSGYRYAYFGAKRVSDGSQEWCWVTGEPFEYTNWTSGEPNDSGNLENWAQMYNTHYGHGQWNDVRDVATNYCYIQERDITDDLTVETPQVSTEDLFFRAKLTAGGFIGAAENTTVEHCSVISVSDGASLLDWHKGNRADSEFSVGEFAGSADPARLSLVAAVERKSDGFAPIDNTSGAWGFAYSEALDVQYTKIGFDHTTGIGRVDKDGRSYELQYSQNLTGEGTKAAYVTARSVVALPSATKGAAVTIPQYVYSGAFFAKVNEIGAKAFENAEIGSIDTKDVETVGDSAFAGSSLTYAYLNDGVRSVGKNIFSGCYELRTIEIGANLTLTKVDNARPGENNNGSNEGLKEEGYLFGLDKGKSNLEAYKVSSKNQTMAAVDGILYELHDSNVTMKNDAGEDQTYRLAVAVVDAPVNSGSECYAPAVATPVDTEDGGVILAVVKIYRYAFANNTKIQKLDLKYIRDIGSNAFDSAAELTTVTFGSADKTADVITLGFTKADGVFVPIKDKDGKDITTAGVGEKWSTLVGSYAFNNCQSLKSVDLSADCLTAIGEGAFAGAGTKTNGLDITIGKNIEYIGVNTINEQAKWPSNRGASLNDHSTFAGAFVRSYAVAEGNEVYRAENGVLYRCVGQDQQDGKEEWYLVAYPTHAGISAFTVASESTNITRIHDNAFQNVTKLTDVCVSDSVTGIGNYAFAMSGSIAYIDIGRGVTGIGWGDEGGDIFAGTYTAFDGCTALKEINVSSDNTVFSSENGVLYNKDKTTLLKYPIAKPGYTFYVGKGTVNIWKFAFCGCRNLRSLVIEAENVSSIGKNAFQGATSLAMIHFKNCPPPTGLFDSNTNLVVDRDTFKTGYGSGTVLAYSVEKDKWKCHEHEYYETSGGSGRKLSFSIEEFCGYPSDSSQLTDDYYAFVVLDSLGYPINGIYIELTPNPKEADTGTETALETETVSTGTKKDDQGQTIRSQAGISMFYNLDYSRSYSLRVVDGNGAYFPYSDTNFRLDWETKITYVTLSSVPTVEGTNVVASVEKSNDSTGTPSDYLQGSFQGHKISLGNAINGGYSIQESIQTEVKRFNNQLFSTLVVSVNASYDQGSEIAGYYLSRNGESVATYKVGTGDDAITKTMTTERIEGEANGKRSDTLKFTLESDFLQSCAEDDHFDVTVKFTNGNSVTSRLNFQIISLDIPTLNFKLMDEFSFTFDKSIPVLGGMTIPIIEKEKSDGSHMPKLTIIAGIDNFRVAVDWNIDDVNGLKDFKENLNGKESLHAWNVWKDRVKSNKLDTFQSPDFEASRETSCTIRMAGYVDVRLVPDPETGLGKVQLESEVSVKLEFEAKFGKTMIVFWVIPLRLDLELNGYGATTATLVWDNDAGLKFNDVTFTLGAGVNASAGIGCKTLSAGLYGSLGVEFVVAYVAQPGNPFDLDTVTLTGDLGAYVKGSLGFVKIDKKWSFFNMKGLGNKLVIWGDGRWFPDYTDPVSYAAVMADLYDSSNYVLAVSEAPTEVIKTAPFSLKDMGESIDLYEDIALQSARVGDRLYFVYRDDMNGYGTYDENNFQKLVCQYAELNDDGTVAAWSEPWLIDDNGYVDGEFKLIPYGDSVAVVYTQAGERIEAADELQAESAETSVSDYLSTLDVRVAILKDGAFEISSITSDHDYDMLVDIDVCDDGLSISWVRNQANDMFGCAAEGLPNRVYRAVLVDGAWVTTELSAYDVAVLDIEQGTNGQVAVLVDTNNDLLTMKDNEKGEVKDGLQDRMLYILTSGEEAESLAAMGAYTDVNWFDEGFVYACEGKLYEVLEDTGISLFPAAVTDMPDDYSILRDEEGNIKAILYVGTTSYGEDQSGSNLYAIFYDAADGWGQPLQITDYGVGNYVSEYAFTEVGGELMVMAILSRTTESDEVVDIDGETCAQFETTYSGRTDSIAYPNGCEVLDTKIVSVTTGEAQVQITIKNTGCTSLDLANLIRVKLGDNEKVVSVKSQNDPDTLAPTLAPGCEDVLTVTFAPGDPTEESYTFTFEQTSCASFDAPKPIELKLWNSDLVVYAKQIELGGRAYLVIRVVNEGDLPSVATTLSAVVNGNAITFAGESTADLAVKALKPGESVYLRPELPELNETDYLLDLTVKQESEDMQANNTCRLNVHIPYSVRSSVTSLTLDRIKDGDTWRIKDCDEIITFRPSGFRFDTTLRLMTIRLDGVDVTERGLFTITYGDTVEARPVCANLGDLAAGTHTFELTFACTYTELDDEGNAIGERTENMTVTLPVTVQGCMATWINHVDCDDDHADCILKREEYDIGDVTTPSYRYEGELPMYEDGIYEYTFIGWDTNGDGVADVAYDPETDSYGEFPPVAYGEMTFTAVFRRGDPYEWYVVWMDGNDILSEDDCSAGNRPEYKGETPTRADDDTYTYTFAGWATEPNGKVRYLPGTKFDPIYTDTAYYAVFVASVKPAPTTGCVLWMNGEEVMSRIDALTFGTAPVYTGETPTRAEEAAWSYTFAGWATEPNGQVVYEPDDDFAPIYADTTYYAVFTATEKLIRLTLTETGGYTLDRENGYVRKVVAQTKVADFRAVFLNDAETIRIVDATGKQLADTALVGTGSKVQLMWGDTVLDELVIIVVGDVNGDGKTNGKDYSRLRKYLNGDDVSINLVAADVTGDGKVNMKDCSRLQKYLNGWQVEIK